MIIRTEKEVERVRGWAEEGVIGGSRYAGMTYEDGIVAVLAWLVGDEDLAPDEEE